MRSRASVVRLLLTMPDALTTPIAVLSLDHDTAVVTVAGSSYTLTLDVDHGAPTGHGGGSGIAWSVDWRLTAREVNDAIGEHEAAINDAINEHGMWA